MVRPHQRLHFERTLKTIELKFGVPRGQCRFENVEGRIDQTGQKVWFVQRDAGRIIATVDLYTGKTTGPDDDPPAWATLNGGKPLPPPAE